MTRTRTLVLLALLIPAAAWAQAPASPSKPAAAPKTPQQTFATAEEAADAMIAAARIFDIAGLKKLLGSDGLDLVTTADKVQDETLSKAFAEQAAIKHEVVRDPHDSKVAILNIGSDDWPSPIPIVQGADGRWHFDTKMGRAEISIRRVGRNELDAIEVCHGYVDAQQEYAFTKHGDSLVNQYAQKIISAPGKQDGLVWFAADGKIQGPIAEPIAKAIAEGYTNRLQPYHGYYFKILNGQGSAAPLGKMNYVVKGAMIGGFALAAAPAEYGKTGVKSFIVSNDGVVYEKDLGEKTLETFKAMTLFNPDKTWSPVETP
jgi:hypothetical protein